MYESLSNVLLNIVTIEGKENDVADIVKSIAAETEKPEKFISN